MRFGAWIPSFAYPHLDYDRARQGTDAFSKKANEHDIDLWVIDHLLHAPGLYGMSWLEPMTVLTHAAAVAPDVEMVGTGSWCCRCVIRCCSPKRSPRWTSSPAAATSSASVRAGTAPNSKPPEPA